MFSVCSAYKLLGFPEMRLEDLAEHVPNIAEFLRSPGIARRVEIEAQYSRFVEQQQAHMEEIKKEANLCIPDTLDISSLAGLSTECKQTLVQARPANVSAIYLCLFIDCVSFLY